MIWRSVLAAPRGRSGRVDTIACDRIVQPLACNMAVARKRVQSGEYDLVAVDLEEFAQGMARVTASEAVRAQRHKASLER